MYYDWVNEWWTNNDEWIMMNKVMNAIACVLLLLLPFMPTKMLLTIKEYEKKTNLLALQKN